MGTYRQTRNCIQSCIERIREILADNNFSDCTVVKSFKQAYNVNFDPQLKNAVICVRVGITVYDNAEVGSDTFLRKPLLLLDLFCSNGGQLEDLKDLLITNLKTGFDYKEYSVSGGITTDAILESGMSNGRIVVNSINETEVNLGDDKSNLDIHDRYRSLITLNCTKSVVEL